MELSLPVRNNPDELAFLTYLHEKGFEPSGTSKGYFCFRLTYELFKVVCEFRHIWSPTIFKRRFGGEFDDIHDMHDRDCYFAVCMFDPETLKFAEHCERSNIDLYQQLAIFIRKYTESAELQKMRKELDDMNENLLRFDEYWKKRIADLEKQLIHTDDLWKERFNQAIQANKF